MPNTGSFLFYDFPGNHTWLLLTARAQATRSTAMSHPNLYYYRPGAAPADATTIDADLCVYGATAAGVAAAVAATRLGRTAVLIEHGGALGGMTAGGLSNTDIGNKR